MNERIAELAKLAQARAEWMTPQGLEWFDNFKEKFAELIVKECAESLWTEECHNSDLALEEFEKNSKKIRKHFGVEE